jgi:6-phosphogluconolactonase (cycloisomerase 2 family)
MQYYFISALLLASTSALGFGGGGGSSTEVHSSLLPVDAATSAPVATPATATTSNNVASVLETVAAGLEQSKTIASILVAAGNGRVQKVVYNSTGNGTLNVQSEMTLCGENPTWLFKGLNRTRFWCVNEGRDNSGSVVRIDMGNDGPVPKYTAHSMTTVPGHPVHAAIYNGFDNLSMAIYSGMTGSGTGGGFSSGKLVDGTLGSNRASGFPSNTTQAAIPHPHQIIPDPTGRFLVIPDLGADLIRIVNPTDYSSSKVPVEPGTGPRHGQFYVPGGNKPSFFFVVGETSNTISTFNVSYAANGSLELTGPTYVISTFSASAYRLNQEVMDNSRAAELKIFDDKLAVSNRLVKYDNSVKDGISSFQIAADGSLIPTSYQELGLANPRSFEISPDGKKILVSFQGGDSSIAVYDRDMKTGNIDPKGKSTSLYIDTRLDMNTDTLGAGINHAIWDY